MPPDPADLRTARLALIGDVMLGRLVSEELGRRNARSFWGDTLPELAAADAVIANLECAISARGRPWSRTPKVFHFRALPAAIGVLKAAGITYVSLANNHVLDYGEDALADTLDHLDAASIAHAGAGRDRAGADRPARFNAKDVALSAFSIVDHERPFAAGASTPGTCYVDPARDPQPWPDSAAMASERASGAHLVLVSAHLGPNMVSRPSPALAAYKRRLVAAGANILHGHSAHVFQGVEVIGRNVILHDCGDFLDDYAVDPGMRNDWSFLFLLDVDRTGVRRILLRPVVLTFAEVNLARSAEADAICDRMVSVSAELGTILTRTDQGLELVIEDVDGDAR